MKRNFLIILVSPDLSTLREQKKKQVPQLAYAYVDPAIWQIQGAKDAVRVDVACPGAKTQRCVALKIVVPNRPVYHL